MEALLYLFDLSYYCVNEDGTQSALINTITKPYEDIYYVTTSYGPIGCTDKRYMVKSFGFACESLSCVYLICYKAVKTKKIFVDFVSRSCISDKIYVCKNWINYSNNNFELHELEKELQQSLIKYNNDK